MAPVRLLNRQKWFTCTMEMVHLTDIRSLRLPSYLPARRKTGRVLARRGGVPPHLNETDGDERRFFAPRDKRIDPLFHDGRSGKDWRTKRWLSQVTPEYWR